MFSGKGECLMDREINQREQFERAARELECDDDPEHFAETVRRVAKAPSAHHSKPARPPKAKDPE